MKKIYILGGVVLLFLLLGFWYQNSSKQSDSKDVSKSEPTLSNPLNTTYQVEGETFTLVNGSSEKSFSSTSASKNTLTVFGTPAYGDIDSDGDDDAVLILVNDSGGSGSFYYAAIAVNTGGQYQGTDTILLGDRIAPQNYRITNNRAEVNYVVRQAGEDFSTPPSVGKTLHLQFDPKTLKLIQVAVDFEGEANPDIMTLDMQPWTWISATDNNTTLTLNQPNAFILTFKDDGSVAIQTDCNSMRGNYKTDGNKITFEQMISTKMFCENSQEQLFAKILTETQSFSFTSRGQLILESTSGSAVFR